MRCCESSALSAQSPPSCALVCSSKTMESDDDELNGLSYNPYDLAFDRKTDLGSDSEGMDPAHSDAATGSSNPPIQHACTQFPRERLGPNAPEKAVAGLDYMDTLGLDFPLSLDPSSWGHVDCIAHPKIHYARTALMLSKELPSIITSHC